MRRAVIGFLIMIALVTLAAPDALAQRRRGIPGMAAATRPSSGADVEIGSGPRPMTEVELQSAGCVVAGGVSTGLAYLAGPTDLLAVMSGAPAITIVASPAVVGLAVFGTVLAAGCAVGALATPSLRWLYDQLAPEAPVAAATP